jgi:hypothetical protein
MAINQRSQKISQDYREEILSVVYTLIFMNSGVFSTLQDFHLQNLADCLTKELNSVGDSLIKTIAISLLLALSPHIKLRKVQGLENALENLKSDFEDDRHFL